MSKVVSYFPAFDVSFRCIVAYLHVLRLDFISVRTISHLQVFYDSVAHRQHEYYNKDSDVGYLVMYIIYVGNIYEILSGLKNRPVFRLNNCFVLSFDYGYYLYNSIMIS